jgi:outer membrane protein TolC
MTRGFSARSGTRVALLLIATAQFARAAHAQARLDTLYLDDLQRAAEGTDRRSSQVALLAKQSQLRLDGIRAERLPTLNAVGSAQYLSDVPNIGAVLPAANIPRVKNDQYDAYVALRQPVLDPTRHARVAVEQALALESQARVRSALWPLRVAVSDAFFGVVLRDAQMRSLDVAIGDLDARIRVAATRVSSGAALQSERLLLQAERARRMQSRDELVMERDATREVLAALTGYELPPSAALAVRAPASGQAYSRFIADTARARPEFAQFDRTRAVLDARRDALKAQDMPRVSAFGRSGYGRPGLNPLGRSFDTYWSAGVQVEWTPWNWGRTRRDLEVQTLQEAVVRSDEVAFRESLRRASVAERARLRSLEHSLAADDSIVSLRALILRETRLRYDEGEVNAADYIARLTEHLNAQLDRDVRRVRLDESRARYLTTLGLEVR